MKQFLNDQKDPLICIKEWLSILDGLRQENVLLKSRLSNALQQKVSRSFIETAEDFQQKFISKDQLIDLLRHEMTGLLERSVIIIKEEKANTFQSRYETLEKDMQRLITEFHLMKTAFGRSLPEKLEQDPPALL
jgi:hypothetical protein